MKEIYIITAGEYSDYHIVAVFENIDKAAAYYEAQKKRCKYSYDEPSIEIYKTYDGRIKSQNNKAAFLYSYIIKGSEAYCDEHFEEKYVDLEITTQKEADKRIRKTAGKLKGRIYCALPEQNIKKACKILSDKFYERKAQLAGVTFESEPPNIVYSNGRNPAKCPNGGIVF